MHLAMRLVYIGFLPLPERMLCSSPGFPQAQGGLSIPDGNSSIATHLFSARHPVDLWILVEVAIKSKSMCDTKPFHDSKAGAINKAEEMIPISAENFQSSPEVFFPYFLESG
jgi:hypothetical protein